MSDSDVQEKLELEFNMYLGLNDLSLLDDLSDDVLLLGGAELVLELAFRGGVEDTLGAVPGSRCQCLLHWTHCRRHRLLPLQCAACNRNGVHLLVRDEDLPAIHDLRQRDGLVGLPVLGDLRILDEDDVVVVLALVVDLCVLRIAPHGCCMVCLCGVWKGR